MGELESREIGVRRGKVLDSRDAARRVDWGRETLEDTVQNAAEVAMVKVPG